MKSSLDPGDAQSLSFAEPDGLCPPDAGRETEGEVLVVAQIKPGEERARQVSGRYFTPLQELMEWERCPTGIFARVDDCRLDLNLVGHGVLRIAISRIGAPEPAPTYGVIGDPSSWQTPVEVEEFDSEIHLTTEEMRVVVGKSPFRIEAFRPDGSPIMEMPTESVLGTYASLNDQFIVTRKRPNGSAILGLGQKTGPVDRSGRSYILWNTDVLNPRSVHEFGADFEPDDPRRDPKGQEFDPYYISIPFYQSIDEQGRAAGFYIDNLHRAHYDFGHPEETRICFDGGTYVEYVFSGPDLASILSSYSGLTGTIKAPPLWSLGYHHCRWHPYRSDDILQLAQSYRERGIPCDSIWLDIDHMRGYRVFTWNKQLFPDPPALLAQLKDMGFRAVTIVDPGVKVEPGNPVYDSGLERGAFCLTEQGAVYQGQVWPGRTAFPDFVSEATREWWGELTAKHLGLGLSGIWNDMNEPATGDIPDTAMRFGEGKYPHGAYHNGYALLMAMSAYKGLLNAMPDLRPFILSRAGSAGIQRFAANWMGDSMSRWEHLQMSIPMSLGLGLSGQPFVGADVGGFGENCDEELLIRWFQAACLTPFCRNHNDAGGVDQYPWSFGSQAERYCREAIHLRYRLLPYLYTAFVTASQNGTPIMKPMIWEDPADPYLRDIEDQFVIGPDLLVAPVVEKGIESRAVRLPKGEWFDWWTNRMVLGGIHLADAPLSGLPLYAKAGSVIPVLSEIPASTMDCHPESLDLHVFVPTRDGVFESVLVEDDGVTHAYQRGQRLTTRFVLTREGRRLHLSAQTEGASYPEFRRNSFTIRLRGAGPVLIETVPAPAQGFTWTGQL